MLSITQTSHLLADYDRLVRSVRMRLGAWRISLRQVLTRRVPAVEMLGAATVLCVDKTGTLTLNRMTATKIAVNGEVYDVENIPASLPEHLHEVVEFSILASPADPFDPMEKAMKELGGRTLSGTEHIHKDWTLLREYPLSAEILAMSRVWQSPDGQAYIIAAKGAPEAIADLCHFDETQRQSMVSQIDRMANHGLRVIAVARASFRIDNLPENQHDFAFEYLGLIGLADPVRPGVPEAVQDCYTAAFG